MEEGDEKKVPDENLPLIDENQLPPPPDEEPEVKVNVLKPFKPKPRVTRIVAHGKCFFHPAKPASYICSSCGKNVCSICARDYGGAFFCPQCAPYERPRPKPTPKPTDNRSWYRALLSIGVILLVIGSLLALLYWPLTSMNAAEFENLMDRYIEDGNATNFKDYTSGDVIVIRDTIARMSVEFDDTYGVLTRLWFESTGKGDEDFNLLFDADLEKDYHVGDTVAITLHVDEDPRNREVIEEYYNNLPDVTNIDNTLAIDLLFYAIIIFGVFLVLISLLFLQKAKKKFLSLESSDSAPESRGDVKTERPIKKSQ